MRALIAGLAFIREAVATRPRRGESDLDWLARCYPHLTIHDWTDGTD